MMKRRRRRKQCRGQKIDRSTVEKRRERKRGCMDLKKRKKQALCGKKRKKEEDKEKRNRKKERNQSKQKKKRKSRSVSPRALFFFSFLITCMHASLLISLVNIPILRMPKNSRREQESVFVSFT